MAAAVTVTVTREHHLWSSILKSGGLGFNGGFLASCEVWLCRRG